MQESVALADLPPPLVDEEGESIPRSHEAHFDRWRPVAEEIPREEVLFPNVEGSLAAANTHGVAARLDEAARAKKRSLASLDVRHELVSNVYGIALAYVWASALLRMQTAAKRPPVAPRMRALRKHRQLMLKVAEAATVAGLIDESALSTIRQGSGDIDAIGDVLLLAVVLVRDAAAIVDSGLLVSRAQTAEAQALALDLQGEIRPKAATAAPAPTDVERAAAQLLRDRLWTLLVRAHAECELVAAHLVGVARVRQLVPALNARVAKPKAVEPTPV